MTRIAAVLTFTETQGMSLCGRFLPIRNSASVMFSLSRERQLRIIQDIPCPTPSKLSRQGFGINCTGEKPEILTSWIPARMSASQFPRFSVFRPGCAGRNPAPAPSSGAITAALPGSASRVPTSGPVCPALGRSRREHAPVPTWATPPPAAIATSVR